MSLNKKYMNNNDIREEFLTLILDNKNDPGFFGYLPLFKLDWSIIWTIIKYYFKPGYIKLMVTPYASNDDKHCQFNISFFHYKK